MSEKSQSLGKYARPAAEITAAGVASALVTAVSIVTLNHRKQTHRSVELHPVVEAIAELDQRSIGVADTKDWAAVHRVHHSIPDATLKPQWEITRAIKWMSQNPDKVGDVKVPDKFSHLDPYVDSFSREDVLVIGQEADTLMRERLGDAYEEPTGYTPEQLQSILNPTEPQYYYPDKPPKGPYTQIDVADILLGDPHSPSRISPNGVKGVLKHNYPLYQRAAGLFHQRPELREADLRNKDDKKKEVTLAHRVAGVLIPSAAVLLRRGKYKPKDFAIAAAAGVAITALHSGYVLMGGNLVNSLGHMGGELDPKKLRAALRNEVFQPSLRPDGTVATDTTGGGLLGRAISMGTLDEAGGQAEHHKHPENIAYTSKVGTGAWVDAPFGMALQTLARSKWFSLVKEGDQFNLKPGERRPDQPIPAMDIIHQRRAEQLKREQKAEPGEPQGKVV